MYLLYKQKSEGLYFLGFSHNESGTLAYVGEEKLEKPPRPRKCSRPFGKTSVLEILYPVTDGGVVRKAFEKGLFNTEYSDCKSIYFNQKEAHRINKI